MGQRMTGKKERAGAVIARDRFTGEYALKERLQGSAGLGPYFEECSPQSGRVPSVDQSSIRFVVQQNALITPQDEHGLSRSED
jgi:hypothetical protein